MGDVALAVPTSLSPSKVSSFRDCGLAFRFSAIDRLYEPPTVPAAKGTLVHRTLELLLSLEPEARTPEAALGLLPQATVDVLDGEEYSALELAGEERAAFVAQAAALVHKYFQLEDPRTIRPEGLELMLEAEVGGVRLRGIIDRLERDADGRLVVTDYKTGRVPGERFEQGKLGGVHFYAFLCEQVLGERPARVQLYYLAEPVAIVAEPSDQSIRGLKNKVGAIWTAVERACERDDFRPNPGKLCDWCAFKEYCPAFGGDPGSVPRLASVG
ncbi:MAG: RecB family exonuclease [Actinomycetia bacterium]|nr:RecB family exonuclease [Actinomycetes bacterium]